jgi:hypothetical protein
MTGLSPSANIHSARKRSFPIWASDIAPAPDARPCAPRWEMLDATTGEAEPQPHPLPEYEFDQRIAK